MAYRDSEERKAYAAAYRAEHRLELRAKGRARYAARYANWEGRRDKLGRRLTDNSGRFLTGRPIGMSEKHTPHASITPHLRDLGWAAGFLEGEGSFAKNGRSSRTEASQVQREPLERLVRYFGGMIIDQPKYHQHRWCTYGARSRGVMMTLYSLMSPRRQQQIRAALGHTAI